MGRKIILYALTLLLCGNAYAGQGVVGNLTVTGNVGVGTASPTTRQKLDVVGNAIFSGNVGVNSASPRASLDVDGVIYGDYYYGDGSHLTGITGGSGLSGLTAGKVLKASSATTAVDSAIYENGGNVSIGTTASINTLEVYGVTPSIAVRSSGTNHGAELDRLATDEEFKILNTIVKTISSGANLIPTMSSNTAPSGVASAESVYLNDGNYYAYKAMDNNASTLWISGAGAPTWLQYQFASAETIDRYTIQSRTGVTNQNPQNWTFQGSNDGSSWTTLDTQTGQSFASASATNTYDFTNTTPYTYYRLAISACNGGTYCTAATLTMRSMAASYSTPTILSSKSNGVLNESGTTTFGDANSRVVLLGTPLFTSGNIGIGTTATNKLDVNGAVAIGTTYASSIVAPTNGLIVAGNVGIGTHTPIARLEVDGTLYLGSVGGATGIEADGTIYFDQKATIWNDLQVDLNPATAVYAPTVTTKYGGRLYTFSDEAVNEDGLPFVAQMPHGWKEGTGIEPHVHFTMEDNTACNIVWKIDYRWTNINVAVGTTDTTSTVTTANGATDVHLLADFPTASGTGKTLSSIITGVLSRNSTNALDTCNGKSAYLLQYDLHYEQDTIGSRTELAK